MRFEEKIAAGRVAKFAVIFGRRRFCWAALESLRLGARDVFLFSDPQLDRYCVSLRYFDYESFDFEELQRSIKPPVSAGWDLTKWPAEKVARLDEERRNALEQLDQKLSDRQLSVKLELPYRLGPLRFLQATAASDPFSTRWDLHKWPDSLRPHLMSLADQWGTQVVFVPEYEAGYVVAGVGPEGVYILHSQEGGVTSAEGVSWANGRINLVSPGNSWREGFCVCDLEKERLFWVKHKR
jgi:hypothetical protein